MNKLASHARFIAKTPPRELVAKWTEDAPDVLSEAFMHIAFGSAQWAARHELEECIDLLMQWKNNDDSEHPALYLCAARNFDTDKVRKRIKERALMTLKEILAEEPYLGEVVVDVQSLSLIKSALETFPD